MNDLVFLPAHQLAKAIRTHQVSATEVLEAHLIHIANHNPKINTFITLDEEGARQRAKEADAALTKGELWGPFLPYLLQIHKLTLILGALTTPGT